MKIAFLSMTMILLFGCMGHKVDTVAEGKKLMELSREWSKSAATNDTAKTLSYWAEDALVLSPGQTTLRGKEAIRGMIAGTAQIPGFKISWEPLSVSVSESGDLAYMVEQNQITVNDSLGNPITEKNKSVTIWKKQPDGSWKNVVDIWNAEGENKK